MIVDICLFIIIGLLGLINYLLYKLYTAFKAVVYSLKFQEPAASVEEGGIDLGFFSAWRPRKPRGPVDRAKSWIKQRSTVLEEVR